MTFEYVERELNAFLGDITPRVIAIKGKWGAGKTFLVRQALESPKNDYAYVSLFGINSLDDLQEATFIQIIANKVSKGKSKRWQNLRKVGCH